LKKKLLLLHVELKLHVKNKIIVCKVHA
jgi:hypothetical protein